MLQNQYKNIKSPTSLIKIKKKNPKPTIENWGEGYKGKQEARDTGALLMALGPGSRVPHYCGCYQVTVMWGPSPEPGTSFSWDVLSSCMPGYSCLADQRWRPHWVCNKQTAGSLTLAAHIWSFSLSKASSIPVFSSRIAPGWQSWRCWSRMGVWVTNRADSQAKCAATARVSTGI